jgi:hypothetical protein
MFVLHVGPHKTATTWMQTNLHHNAAALEKAGWLYPQMGERVVIAHHDLSDHPAEILEESSRKTAAFRKIAEKAAAGNLNVLLSSEGFSKWRPQHLKRLREIMAPHEMRIVYTLRDPVSLTYSLWAQKVKTGGPKSLPQHYEEQVRKAGKSRSLDPLTDLQKYRDVENAGLTVLLYDEIVRQGRDIFDVLTQDVLSIGKLPHAESGTANEREPLEMTEFMRAMLVRMGRWKGGERVNIGRVFKHMLTGATRKDIIDAVAAVPQAKRVMTMRRDDEAYLAMERKLLKRFSAEMVPPPGAKLFLEGEATFDYYDDTVLAADPRVKALLDDLTKKFRPGGLRMTLANLARSSLMGWRRLVNRFR